jgi:hypothetical protein
MRPRLSTVDRPAGITRERVVFGSAVEKARWLGEAARRDAELPFVRWAARTIASPDAGPIECAEAFFRYCRDGIAFVDDPGDFETFESSDVILERGYDDCDGKARCFVALCLARGIPARVRNIFGGEDDYYHVQAEVRLPHSEVLPAALPGGWLICEFTLPDVELGQGGEARAGGAYHPGPWLSISPEEPSRWSRATEGAAEAGSLERDQRHRDARPILLAAWRSLFGGDEPDLTELQMAGAQASGETLYGHGWSAASGGQGSNNWGAVDWTPRDPPGEFFQSTDTDANGNTIGVKFRTYPTPLDGAVDFLKQALVIRPLAAAVIDNGNATSYADALRRSHYFVAPVSQYALMIRNNAAELARALGEPLMVALDSDGNPGGSASAGSGGLVALGLAAAAAIGTYVFTRKSA